MSSWKLPHVNSSLNGCKILTENLTFRILLKWKNGAFNTTLKMYFFQSQIWRVVKILNQNLTRFEIFNSKSCSLEKHQKCKICRFHGVKWTKRDFLDANIFSNTWHVQNFLIQNITRCIFFNPKSDAFWNFLFKIWRVLKFFFQNLTR